MDQKKTHNTISWKQIHSGSRAQVRDEITINMVAKEIKNELAYERRNIAFSVHFISFHEISPYTKYLITFFFVLAIPTFVIDVIAFHIPSNYGEPLTLLPIALLTTVALFKPYRHWRPQTS